MKVFRKLCVMLIVLALVPMATALYGITLGSNRWWINLVFSIFTLLCTVAASIFFIIN